MIEKDKLYSFMVGVRDIIARVHELNDEELVLEYAVTLVPLDRATLAPMPLDKFGEQRFFQISRYAVEGYWEVNGKVEAIYQNYLDERKLAEAGLVTASADTLNKLKK